MIDDPTQTGGQDPQPTPAMNARNAAMAQIAQNAHAVVAEEFAGFNEETGEIDQTAPKEEETKPETEAKQDEKPAEVPPQKRVRSITVDGQASEVDEDKIIEAGIRTLQKESAADRRLQEATRLKQQAEELLNRARTGQQNTAPSQDAPQTAQAIEGITPETLTTLAQGLEPVIAQRVMTQLTAQQAVAEFRKEFSDIASDPDLWMIAVAKNQARIDHATAVGAPAGDDLETYRKIGNEIRAKFVAPKAPEPAAQTDRAERKRTITAIPAVNAKAPAPQEQKPKSIPEQIEEMRKLRSQGFRTQGFSRLKS